MTAAISSKLIRVGHSPDPDDAFMFYALAKQKIPMQDFRVEHVIEDIESLNQRALRGELEVTAVSCHAYPYLCDRYAVMRSGASVGDQYGPILVGKRQGAGDKTEGSDTESRDSVRFRQKLDVSVRTESQGNEQINIRGKKIAVPGKLTTAYLVLQLYSATEKADPPYGGEKDFEPVFIPFDQIFDAVLSGKADLGLVIHEGQITYQEKGLSKIVDLGEWWFEKYQLPLPLGVDVIRRDLGKETIESFSQLFKESIQYALDHRKEALDYALQYGRGIDQNLGDQFVGMYVNHYTVDLGKQGEAGLQKLLDEGYEKGIVPRAVKLEFV